MGDPSSCKPPLRHGFSSIQLPHYMPQEVSQATLHMFLANLHQPLLQRPWCLLIGNVVKRPRGAWYGVLTATRLPLVLGPFNGWNKKGLSFRKRKINSWMDTKLNLRSQDWHLTFLILLFYHFSSSLIILVPDNITVIINLFSTIDLISKKPYLLLKIRQLNEV